MNRRRNLWLGLVSILMSCLLVYVLYAIQLKHFELQQRVDVVVPTQFIDAGKMLTAEVLTFKSIVMSSYDPRMFHDMEAVIGQETGMALGQGEPILDWKLNKFSLLPNYGQSTFQIPKSFILSVSNGIRAGDKVRIYKSSMHESGQSGRLFDEDITVASVKTSANTEVEDTHNSSILAQVKGDQEQLYASRRNANAVIDHINLNLTEKQWLLIDRLCRNEEVKLVIAFTSSFRFQDEITTYGLKEEIRE